MNLFLNLTIILLFIYYLYQIGEPEPGLIKIIVLAFVNISIILALHLLSSPYLACLAAILVTLLYDLFYDSINIRLNICRLIMFSFIYILAVALNLLISNVTYPIAIEIIILYMMLSITYSRKLLNVSNAIILSIIYSLLIYLTYKADTMQTQYLMMVAAILIYLSVEALYKRVEYSFKKSTKYFQENLLHTQYEEIKNIYLNMRGFRHDYHTHIQTLKAYFSMNSIDEAAKYLNELETELDRVDNYVKSGNLMVDAILNSKLTLADSKSIKFNCKANVPENITISDIDICIILGNLLDNAIEGCEKIDENKRFLRVYMSIIKKQLYISIQNSAKEELNFNEKNYISTKRGNHGLGMKRVKILIDKYDGYINLQNEPGIFACEVSIPQ